MTVARESLGPDSLPVGATIGRKRESSMGSLVVKWLTSTDHKVIGNLYMITSFIWFLLGGLMALVIRLELWAPGLQVVDNPEQFNEMFTMHGTIMLLLFATPAFAGFANALMPLQIGDPDVAFPRLNMFAYWLYLFGGIIAAGGLLTPGGAASFGWTAYTPLSDPTYSPGVGGDLWVWGLALSGFGTILGGVNFITTIICMRAPGMTMFRMPIFTWTVLITSILMRELRERGERGEDETDGRQVRYIQAQVDVVGNYVVATRDIERGTLITSDMLGLRDGNLSSLAPQTLTDQADIIGKVAQRPIRSGGSFQAHFLQAPHLVERGQRVTVIAQGTGFRVSREGEAMTNGALGDIIRVRFGAREIAMARVTGQGVLVVDF